MQLGLPQVDQGDRRSGRRRLFVQHRRRAGKRTEQRDKMAAVARSLAAPDLKQGSRIRGFASVMSTNQPWPAMGECVVPGFGGGFVCKSIPGGGTGPGGMQR